MSALIRKEFSLCLHPTCMLFLSFALFVFIPNYLYEVMFFFSGLSVFFVCLTARENGDTAFTAGLPVRRRDFVTARILFCVILQCALLLLAGAATAVKETCLPAELQINMAGSTANLAFLGYGAILSGMFNLIFFPMYFKNTDRIGIPFLLASIAEFFVIALLILLRFTVFSETLNLPDPAFLGAKSAVLCGGLMLYAGFTVFSVMISSKRFSAVDL